MRPCFCPDDAGVSEPGDDPSEDGQRPVPLQRGRQRHREKDRFQLHEASAGIVLFRKPQVGVRGLQMSALFKICLVPAAPNAALSVVHRFVRQCLSLLSALVAQGPEAAREVLSHILTNKVLSGLAKRKDKKVWCCIWLSFRVFSVYWSCGAL